jgi:tetratricopeptide (TPR) repeat protein
MALYLHHEIGRLVDALRTRGVLERAALMIVGDHGEGLEDHGEASHGTYCYQTTMHVPMLLRHPDGTRAGERSREIVSTVDVLPTLAEAIGLGAPTDDLDGISLWSERAPADRGVYFESYAGYLAFGLSPLAGFLDANGKYLHSSEPEFYDVARDPGEAVDLFPQSTPERLRPYRLGIARVFERPVLDAEEAGFSEDLLDELRGLGYASVGNVEIELPNPLAPTDLPSPRSRIAQYRALLSAIALDEQGQHERALPIYAAIVADNPRNLLARELLGIDLVRLDRFEEAATELAALVAERPKKKRALYHLGLSYARLQRYDDALGALRATLALDPKDGDALRELCAVYEAAGRAAEAAECRERAAELVE